MKQLIILVGPPGSGKSTLAKQYEADGFVRCSQDDEGKLGHMVTFRDALHAGKDIVVDRMNFSRDQRKTYLEQAKTFDYDTHIAVIHFPRRECFKRMQLRKDHPTIQDDSSANSALNVFFSKYEKPLAGEADLIRFINPVGERPQAIIVDLDGTLCNLDNRLHHVRPPAGVKKNWKGFFDDLEHDIPHEGVATIVRKFEGSDVKVVFASGRPDDFARKTTAWLEKFGFPSRELYMRCRGDHREDFVAKEIILDFEILTRYTPLFFIDDRQQVIDLWRRRGFVALQCAKGDF